MWSLLDKINNFLLVSMGWVLGVMADC